MRLYGFRYKGKLHKNNRRVCVLAAGSLNKTSAERDDTGVVRWHIVIYTPRL